MNIQTKRWARPLALFIALTMVMMYSFGGVVFASINDVRVHYHGPSDDGVVVVITTVSSEGAIDQTFTAEAKRHKKSSHYDGKFSPSIDQVLSNGDKLIDEGVVTRAYTTINGIYTELTVDHSSAIGNNSANIKVGPPPTAKVYNLMITKTVDKPVVPLDGAVKFTITVTNIGNTLVSGVVVTDEIPAGLLITATYSAVGTFAGDVWTIGDLASGQQVTLEIDAITTDVDEITNTATVSFDGDDVDEDDNTASATVDVLVPYDLSLTKSVNPGSVGISEEALFTIKVENKGFYEATNVVVKDVWPDGLEFIGATSSDAIQFNAEDMTWTLGSLAPGATKTITLSGISAVADDYTNTASVTFSGIDQNPNDNSDTATLKVLLERDLGITKVAAPTNILLNESTVFTVTITNNGTETINNIFVEDVMEAGLSISAIGSDDFKDGIWDVGTLESGESKILTIAAIGTTVGSLQNQVEIVTLGDGNNEVIEYVPFEDDNQSNNSEKATVTVSAGGGGGGGGGGTGGGGGGGTTIQETTPPLTNIPDGETPLVEAPEVMLEEQPIPLADVPQTGDNTNIWLLLALMMGSGAGIVLLGRRKETVEK